MTKPVATDQVVRSYLRGETTTGFHSAVACAGAKRHRDQCAGRCTRFLHCGSGHRRSGHIRFLGRLLSRG